MGCLLEISFTLYIEQEVFILLFHKIEITDD